MSLILTHETTEAEQKLRIELILFLSRIGFSGELNCRSLIANQKGQVRRPDFYLPRYALAIEVDGRTRDTWYSRQSDITPRDSFYQSIGTHPPLIIPANWIVSECKMTRFKYELARFLFTNRLDPRKRNTINKRIHDGRKLLEKRNPEIFKDHGTETPQFLYELSHLKEYRHFGGTKFILRSKYKVNQFNKLEFPWESPEAMQKYIQGLQNANKSKTSLS